MGYRLAKTIWLRVFLPMCLVLSVCLIVLQTFDYSGLSHTSDLKSLPNGFVSKLQADKATNEKIISSLNHQIQDLEKMLLSKQEQLKRAEELGNKLDTHNVSVIDLQAFADGDVVSHILSETIAKAEVLKPHKYKNEFELIPFTVFNKYAVYQLDSGLGRHPEASLRATKDREKELYYIVKEGVNVLNKGVVDGKWFTQDDFVEGLYRTERNSGTQYELVFQHFDQLTSTTTLRRVTLFRALAPAREISETILNTKEIVHVIVPLSGRLDSFKVFLEKFKTEAIKGDGYVHLTVVYFGNEFIADINILLKQMEVDTNFKAYKVVQPKEKQFARGLALHKGMMSLEAENPLMFFCDVDISFTRHFLDQSRFYTVPNRMVFYPIVFSLYNPAIVYDGKMIPTTKHQEVYKAQNGFWRDFGFGMACMYKNDYIKIGGFDLSIKGWGSEDVLLYRKFVQSPSYQVIRTPINYLFHHWHPKNCDKTLPKGQYEACLRTKSITEASHVQIGTLYFKNQEK